MSSNAVRGTRTRVLVNDRLDVALATGAHGVHLRERLDAGVACEVARADRVSDRAIRAFGRRGRIAHADGGLDYLLFGAVFATASKPGSARPPACRHARRCRGGDHRCRCWPSAVFRADTVPQLAGTGSAGFAAIGWFADGDEARESPQTPHARFEKG